MKQHKNELNVDFELLRHRDIILATIDYLLTTQRGSIVFDHEDIVADYYEQQKFQIEKYYKQRRLDRLQGRLLSLTKGLQNRANLAFTGYIKEKTGYDIDIFKEMPNRVDAIIVQKEVRNQKELNDISTMLHFYQQTSAGGEIIDKLKALLIDYSKRTAEPTMSAASRKRKAVHAEIINSFEKDGVEVKTVKASIGPKPKHLKEQDAISPDGKRRLVTQWSDGKHASTCVVIVFPTASGAVYWAHGVRQDVKAFWKDNSTIVIEFKKGYPANAQHREVRSFDDVITIEYIEH